MLLHHFTLLLVCCFYVLLFYIYSFESDFKWWQRIWYFIFNWSGPTGSQTPDLLTKGQILTRSGDSAMSFWTFAELIISNTKKIIDMNSFPAWGWIKGTDAHREAAPASEIHPVTYGTGLRLRFFPSDSVNEEVFSFPRTQRENCSFRAHLPHCKMTNSSLIHLSKDFLVSRSSRRPRSTFDHANKMFSSFYFRPSLVRVFHYMLSEPEAQIGVRCPLNNMEFIVYLRFTAACVDHSASKFHVCVCVSV